MLDIRVNQMVEIMKILANETRLKIIIALLDGEKDVGVLVSTLNENRASVSSQLQKLKVAGFIQDQKMGRTRIYYLQNKERFEKMYNEIRNKLICNAD